MPELPIGTPAHGNDQQRPADDLARSTHDQVDFNATGTGVPEPSTLSAPVPTSSAVTPGHRFTVVRLHAQGGLGQVSLARDEKLNRPVALKEIRADKRDNAYLRQRFLTEAEITGQLEHPGIVPIYDIDKNAEGHVRYAMRFIQGRTLSDAIRDYHRQPTPLGFLELLQRFVSVCQTVAYAHSQGVIHRDLKPANVILGDYGETLVVDWGLAKRLRAAPINPALLDEPSVPGAHVAQQTADYVSATAGEDVAKRLAPALQGAAIPDTPAETGSLPAQPTVDYLSGPMDEGQLTQAGQVLGTPAYMAPEQAEGDIERTGSRADNYSLGAILYEILAGRPPYEGKNVVEVLTAVRQGQFARPTQVRSGVPRALEAVSLKALSYAIPQRYVTAGELAKDVEHWLADEPVSAWREPRRMWWGRWARRHKALVAAAGVLLVTAVVALSISTLVVTQAQKQTEEARQQESDQRRRAQANLHKALEAVDLMLTRVGEKRLAEVPQMDEVRQRLLEDALAFYQGFVGEGSTDPEVRREMGRAYLRTGRIRQLLGKHDEAENDYREALAVQTKLTGEFPDEPSYTHDLAISHHALGDLYRTQHSRTSEAEQEYRKALRLLNQLERQYPDRYEFQNSLAATHNSLGLNYQDTERITLAESEFKEALRIRYELAQLNPLDLGYQNALAESYESLGELYSSTAKGDRAEPEFQKAVNIREHLNRHYPKDPEYQSALAECYNMLGYGYESSSQYVKAEDPYEKAFRIWDRLAREHPTVLSYQTGLGISYRYLGRLYQFNKRMVEAESYFRRSIEIFERLIREYPEQARIVLDFANTADNMATFLREKDNHEIDLLKKEGKHDDAKRKEKESLEKALPLLARNVDLLQDVLQKEPRYTAARNRLVSTYMGRAEIMVRLDRMQEASNDWDQMIELGKGQTSPHLRMYSAMALAHRGGHAQATAEVESLQADKLEPENAFYNFACIYSLSSVAVFNDVHIPLPEQKRLAEQYAARSVEILSKARTDGFFSNTSGYVDYVKTDTDLDPLRSRDDYKKLMRQLEDDAKESPGNAPK